MSFNPSTFVAAGLNILSNELNNDMSFNTMLKPAKLVALEGNTAVVEVPNDFMKSVIERRYLNLIKDVISSILNQKSKLS